jgi:hypothetical protein
MDVRFVVAIDIDGATSLDDAYGRLRALLPAACAYETTEEFFVDGDQGEADDLTRARLRVLTTAAPPRPDGLDEEERGEREVLARSLLIVCPGCGTDVWAEHGAIKDCNHALGCGALSSSAQAKEGKR